MSELVARLVALLALLGLRNPSGALRGYVTSLIRTGTPLIAGWLLAHLPLVADHVSSGQAQTAVAFGLAFVYYAAVRLAEAKWPALGALLGVPQAPQYGGVTVQFTPAPKHAKP